MTFIERLSRAPKNFPLLKNVKNAKLLVHGQGVFLFTNQDTTASCTFTLMNSDATNGLKIQFTTSNVLVQGIQNPELLKDPSNKQGLVNLPGAFYWFSLDSQNQVLSAGIGEPRKETAIYTYRFPNSTKEEFEQTKQFLESLTTIQIPEESSSLTPLGLIRDPITANIPLKVKPTDDLTMMDVATSTYMPSANLSQICQKLYNCISGKKFVLDDASFPDFSKAIEYSIATPGLWCYERLKQKATEFNKDKPDPSETYLRITLGQNNGESPGIPYVMEIWPVGHYSPIHNHAGANAIIRVLHGEINVSLFSFLCEASDPIQPFASASFKKDDVTWITPNLNQIHQLRNLVYNKDTCITIQCYMYDTDNSAHYDYFDYLDADGNKQQYEPDSDMDFVEFKNLMRKEWEARPQKAWYSFC